METDTCFLGGADRRSISSTAKWLAQQGFNAIRLPLAADAILNPDGHPCTLKGNQEGLRINNMVLGGLSYMKQIGEIAAVASDAGLLVLLDMHVMRAGVWPDGGSVSMGDREALLSAWRALATEFCDERLYWNVFGADLNNEVTYSSRADATD